MLFESAHVRVTAEYGVGTLWLGFPGEPVNALDWPRLAELDSALAAIEANPFLHALVVRSAKPAGFCAGLHPSVAEVTDRATFAALGQRVFARLAGLPFVTVAFIDGPCLGVGLELALACDHRLCVATPRTHLGFPHRLTCFGGSARLRKLMGRRSRLLVESGRTLSGREARDLGLVDRAFCARRAKIELRTFLDELEQSPRVPACVRDETGWADERRAFAALPLTSPGRVPAPVSGASRGAGGEGEGAGTSGPGGWGVGDSNLLTPHPPGGTSLARRPPPQGGGSEEGHAPDLPTDIEILLARGFITPLEAEQMRAKNVSEPPPATAEPAPTPAHRRAA